MGPFDRFRKGAPIEGARTLFSFVFGWRSKIAHPTGCLGAWTCSMSCTTGCKIIGGRRDSHGDMYRTLHHRPTLEAAFSLGEACESPWAESNTAQSGKPEELETSRRAVYISSRRSYSIIVIMYLINCPRAVPYTSCFQSTYSRKRELDAASMIIASKT